MFASPTFIIVYIHMTLIVTGFFNFLKNLGNMVVVKLFQKSTPSSRIRTSDLRIPPRRKIPLQSSALPTELSKVPLETENLES